jgi:hypothetical protein
MTSSSSVYSPVSDISNSYLKDQPLLFPIIHPSKNDSSIPFWSDNLNILFRFPDITEIFPSQSMTYNQNLNAISRLVLLITLVTFFLNNSYRILIIGILTLVSIWFVDYYKKKKEGPKKKVRFVDDIQEGYANPTTDLLNSFPKESEPVFQEPTSSNPFSNTLITDYDYNPHKKPAPPCYNEITNDQILEQAKLLVAECNPDQPDITEKLFGDLGDQLIFEQSLRPFLSNPGTTIPNDQTAFAEFCYGSMISCKEGNPFACARNLGRHTNV